MNFPFQHLFQQTVTRQYVYIRPTQSVTLPMTHMSLSGTSFRSGGSSASLKSLSHYILSANLMIAAHPFAIDVFNCVPQKKKKKSAAKKFQLQQSTKQFYMKNSEFMKFAMCERTPSSGWCSLPPVSLWLILIEETLAGKKKSGFDPFFKYKTWLGGNCVVIQIISGLQNC